MAQGDPIKYSDFISPDQTFDDTIQGLQQIEKAYLELEKKISSGSSISLKIEDPTKIISDLDTLGKAYDDLQKKFKEGKPFDVKMDDAVKITKQIDEISDAVMNLQKNLVSSADKMLNAFNAVNGSTQGGRKAIKQMADGTDKLVKAQLALDEATSETGKKLLALRTERSQETRLLKLQAQLAGNAKDSYLGLAAQYELNKNAINSMSQAEREANADFIEESKRIYEQMNEMQAATGKNQLAVGGYEDAIKKALGPMMDWKVMIWQGEGSLEGLKGGLSQASEGVKGFGKQLLKLLANPVVAVIAAIAVVIMVMVKAFKSVIDVAKGNEEQAAKLEKAMQPIRVVTDAVTRALEKLADVVIKVIGWIMKAIVAFTDFMGITDDAAGATARYVEQEERKLALAKANRRELEESAKRELEVAELRDKVAQKDKYNAEERLKMLDKAIALEQESALERKKLAEEHLALLELEGERTANSAEFEDKLTQARVAVTKATTDLFRTTRRMNSERSRTVKEIEGEVAIQAKKTKEIRKESIEREKIERESIHRIQDIRIRAMEASYSKDTVIINAQYDKQIDDLKFKLRTEDKLTKEAKQNLNEEIILLEKERSAELGKLWDDFAYAQNEKEIQALELKLDTIKRGSEQEFDTRLSIMDKQREQELQRNRELAEEMRQDEGAINAKYDKMRADEHDNYLAGTALTTLDQTQAMAQLEFDLMRATEGEKTRFKLQAEKERWEQILAINEEAANKMSEQEVAIVRGTIKKLNNEMAKSARHEDTDIYSMMGIKLDDEEKEAITDSTNFALQNVSSILSANAQLASQAVNDANSRIDKAQEALDAEIEASKAGLANNTEDAQKKLEEEKKNQEKALADKKKAQKAQEAIDLVTQTTSLITATADIWKSLSGIPVVGPALASAAVGSMWTSFGASKIKAKQMTKKEYGEGGLEFLEGGSHRSGNDIPIGNMTDGRQRTAEGGEALAVINRRNTTKYRGMLPAIIDSLNAGTFEKVFADKSGGTKVNVNLKPTNLNRLESGVNDLVSQGDRRVYTDSQGGKYEVYKNRTRKLN